MMPDAPAVLQVENAVKRFGGLTAVDHVSLEVLPQQIHALIGPNGAGKSTLTNLIGGSTPLDQGRITLNGTVLNRRSMAARARLGLGRSFQVSSIFNNLTVADNLRAAVVARYGGAWRFWQRASRHRGSEQRVAALIARFGLGALANQPAATLAHGQKRVLELALALCGKPGLLMLDEPLAGLGPEEAHYLVGTLQSLKADAGILLIEHDMQAVFALADWVTVLVNGRVIASGPPAAIREDADVQRAYLGDG